MKAVLSDKPFSDPDWIFERKLDGIRCIAIRDASGVSLMSRTARRMNDQFPEIAEALSQEPVRDFIIDGEIVAFRDGITSFERLQQRHRKHVPVFLYVFDLPRLEGEDLRPLPLRERKSRLRHSLRFEGPIRFNPHRNGEHGEELYREACRKGLEGVIAKRADSPYTGTRSRDWLKLKCHHEQELVIGGFTAPKGSRTEFGALLVGYNENGALRYAGKVGTGFDHESLRELGARMRELEHGESPFAPFKPIPPGTRWVRAELVGQFGFAEWTRDGRLRHPRYLGLRDDKRASEVVREVPS
jgi:bifunctional non-homologous end joining protein LigD